MMFARSRIIGCRPALRKGSCKAALASCLVGLLMLITSARAIIIFRDPGRELEPPADAEMKRCWDLHGAWQGATGVIVARDWFITSAQMGARVGGFFDWGGRAYRTTEVRIVPNSDLLLYRIDGSFPDWVEFWDDACGSEAERDALLIGRGCARGAAVQLGAKPSPGWLWGDSDGRLSWGKNVISHVFDAGESRGGLLVWTWDNVGNDLEGTLAVGDCGGGLFLKDDQGHWRLAGIHFNVDPSVDGSEVQYGLTESGDPFWAAIHDGRNMWKGSLGQSLRPVEVLAEKPAPMWAGATRIAPHTSFIKSVFAHSLPVEAVGSSMVRSQPFMAGVVLAGLALLTGGGWWLSSKLRRS